MRFGSTGFPVSAAWAISAFIARTRPLKEEPPLTSSRFRPAPPPPVIRFLISASSDSWASFASCTASYSRRRLPMSFISASRSPFITSPACTSSATRPLPHSPLSIRRTKRSLSLRRRSFSARRLCASSSSASLCAHSSAWQRSSIAPSQASHASTMPFLRILATDRERMRRCRRRVYTSSTHRRQAFDMCRLVQCLRMRLCFLLSCMYACQEFQDFEAD
mmetsp:Transcript_33769/g.80144  ORF Transcript_33769/g.80144 Transcript_33769/m.80144 type:complete len:220 (+) Transcript_33769:383-1042(+)